MVLDTNVLSYADNSQSDKHPDALNVVKFVHQSSLKWVLDDQGKAAPDPSTSLLYSEYLNTLAPQGYSLTVFYYLLQTARVSFAARPDRNDRQEIRKLVPKNTFDQAVLGAALGSADHVLVSDDYRDFPAPVRRAALKRWGVIILGSVEAALA